MSVELLLELSSECTEGCSELTGVVTIINLPLMISYILLILCISECTRDWLELLLEVISDCTKGCFELTSY